MNFPIQSNGILRNSLSQQKKSRVFPSQISSSLSPFPSFGGLQFCYCRTRLGGCQLFFGTEEACNNCNRC